MLLFGGRVHEKVVIEELLFRAYLQDDEEEEEEAGDTRRTLDTLDWTRTSGGGVVS